MNYEFGMTDCGLLFPGMDAGRAAILQNFRFPARF